MGYFTALLVFNVFVRYLYWLRDQIIVLVTVMWAVQWVTGVEDGTENTPLQGANVCYDSGWGPISNPDILRSTSQEV